MSAVVIEHLKASDLPAHWAERLHANPDQTFTVTIEPETETAEAIGMFAVDDPAFGIWRDRVDMEDVEAHMAKLRAPRYLADGSRADGSDTDGSRAKP